MHTSLYDEVGSKYGLERGDSIDGRNVQHLHKRDYIRKLSKEAKQAEKAVKGLQTMVRKLETQIYNYQTQLEEIDRSLASGQIALREYESRKSEILKQISEYQSKLEIRQTNSIQRSWNWSRLQRMRQKSVLLSSHSVTTK